MPKYSDQEMRVEMDQITIRQYQPADQGAVMDICYHTGYMGEDLSGQNRFNDEKLFADLFCLYYLRYETENCFVAVTDRGVVAGYIIGTADSDRQGRDILWKMGMKIGCRLLLVTSWRYPESFAAIFHFAKSYFREHPPLDLHQKYPAHLHLNLLAEYQGLGIGSRLIGHFEGRMASLAVPGIHLKTTSFNRNAVIFYQRRGYQLIYDHLNSLWPGAAGSHNLIFAKELKRGELA